MTPLIYIRKRVFQMNQTEFGNLLGCTQSNISASERKDVISHDLQKAIRQEAKRLELQWDDAWFFEVPEEAA